MSSIKRMCEKLAVYSYLGIIIINKKEYAFDRQQHGWISNILTERIQIKKCMYCMIPFIYEV